MWMEEETLEETLKMDGGRNSRGGPQDGWRRKL